MAPDATGASQEVQLNHLELQPAAFLGTNLAELKYYIHFAEPKGRRVIQR